MLKREAGIIIRVEPSPAIRGLRRVGQEISALYKQAARGVTLPLVTGGTAATMGASYMPGVGFVAGSAAMARRGMTSEAAAIKSAQTEAAVVGTAAAARVAGGWDKARGAIRGMSGALFSLRGMAATYGLLQVVRSASDAASTMEKLRRSFAVFYGDAQRGNRELAKVVEVGKKTMFEAVDVAEAKRMLKAYQIDSERVLMAVADTAAATGYRLESVAMALGRIRAGVYGEGFELLRRVGITRKELEGQGLRFAKSGQFVGEAEQAVNAAVGVMERRFGEMSVKMNRTWQGRLSTMGDNWRLFVAPLGQQLHDSLMPTIDGIGTALEGMTLRMKGLRELAKAGSEEDLMAKIEQERVNWEKPGLLRSLQVGALDLADMVRGGLGMPLSAAAALLQGWGAEGALRAAGLVHERLYEGMAERAPTATLRAEAGRLPPGLAGIANRELFRRDQALGAVRQSGDRDRINALVAELGKVEQQRIAGEADVRRGIRGDQTEALSIETARRVAADQPERVRERLLVEVERRDEALATRREAGIAAAGELKKLMDRADAIVAELRGLNVRVIVPQDRAQPRQAVPIARPQPLGQAERVVAPERITALSTWRTQQQPNPFRERRDQILADREHARGWIYPAAPMLPQRAEPRYLRPEATPRRRDAAKYEPLPWPGAELSMYEPALVPREAYQQQQPTAQPLPAQGPPAAAMQSYSVDNRSVNIYASSPPSALVGMARQYWER